MRKHVVLMTFLVSLVSVTGFLLFGPPVDGQSQPPPKDFFGDLNNKSRLATPNNDASINDLVNEVFNFMLIDLTEVPSQVRDRIARTEKRYRNNQRGGIAEVKAVEVVNGLADRFNAPQYARTGETEIRDLRISMMPFLSQFVGTFRASEANNNSSVNQTINASLSPTEAVLIVLMMIQQKQSNPFYQMTPAEKNAVWDQMHSKDGLGKLPDNDTRVQELQQLTNVASALSDTEKLGMANRALDILGMDQ